jgi:hypothetical protein
VNDNQPPTNTTVRTATETPDPLTAAEAVAMLGRLAGDRTDTVKWFKIWCEPLEMQFDIPFILQQLHRSRYPARYAGDISEILSARVYADLVAIGIESNDV